MVIQTLHLESVKAQGQREQAQVNVQAGLSFPGDDHPGNSLPASSFSSSPGSMLSCGEYGRTGIKLEVIPSLLDQFLSLSKLPGLAAQSAMPNLSVHPYPPSTQPTMVSSISYPRL